MKNFSKILLSIICLISTSGCLMQVEKEEPVYTVKVEVEGEEDNQK